MHSEITPSVLVIKGPRVCGGCGGGGSGDCEKGRGQKVLGEGEIEALEQEQLLLEDQSYTNSESFPTAKPAVPT